MSTVAIGKIESIEGRVEVIRADGSADTPGQGTVVYAEDVIFDNIAVHLTDTDGDFNDSTLTIKVIDDVPRAGVDTDRVLVSHMTNGNVITGMDTVTGFDPAADGDILNIADLLVDEPLLDLSTDALLAVVLDGSCISIATGTDTTVTMPNAGHFLSLIAVKPVKLICVSV